MSLRALALLLLTAALPLGSPLWGADAASVAYLVRVRGPVRVQRPGVELTGKELYRLRSGDRLVVGPGASLGAVFFQAGAEYRLQGSCQALVTPAGLKVLPGPGKQPAPPALVRKQDAVLARQAGRAPGEFSRRLFAGAAKGISRLRAPRPVGALEGEPVVLRWANGLDLRAAPPRVREEARLQVFLTSEQGDVLLEETLPLDADHFELPPGTVKPGQLYAWEVFVAARGLGRQRAGGRLWLLSPQERAEAAALRKAAAAGRAREPRDPAVPLLLALGSERLGLAHEAAAAYREVLRLDPENRPAREGLEALAALLDDAPGE